MRSISTLIALLVALAVSSVGARAQADLSYFRFNEGCGTITEDLAAGANANLVGGAGWGFGIIGRAAAFTGGIDRIVTNRAITLTGDWTIEFWANLGPETDADYILGSSTTGSSSTGFRCFFGGAANDVTLRGGGLANTCVTGVTTNVWHHIAFAYDQSALELVPYLDGVAQPAVVQPAGPFTIGNLVIGGNGAAGASPTGRIDELRIWSSERSAAQIASFMTVEVGSYDRLQINGVVPTPVSPTVALSCPLTADISIGGASIGEPVLLLAGPGVSCNNLPVPWGGSVDVLAPVILSDGLTPDSGIDFFSFTPMAFSITFPDSFASSPTGPVFQAIVRDTSNGPFNLRNTAAGAIGFSSTSITNYTLGDDSVQTHPLTGGRVVDFGGTSYTDLFISSNGIVTFGAADSDFSPTPAEFFNGFQTTGIATTNPGVAVLWSDLNRGGTSSGAEYVVCESGFSSTATVQVQFNNQIYWNSLQPAGSFSVTFERNINATSANLVRLDYTGLLPHIAGLDQDPIIGVSDGDETVGTDSTVNLTTSTPFISPATPNSIMEQFTPTGGSGAQVDLSLVDFIEIAPFNWVVTADQ